MKRFLYHCVICLHPRSFREQFGDQMLSIFDEASAPEWALFISDAVISLARQWVFRSRIWKVVLGAVLSSLLLFSWAYSEASWEREQNLRASVPEATPVDRAEFNREAAEAVAMLARFQQMENRKRHSSHSVHPVPALSNGARSGTEK